MARLGDICKFQSGGTPSKGNHLYFGGDIPWITTVALNGNIIDENDAVNWITEKAIAESGAKIVPANSIMLGTRVGVGKVAINSIPMSTNQDIISLLGIDEAKWNKSFICKWLTSRSNFLQSQARGATIKGITIETVSNLELPDISIEEQHSISLCLEHVSQLISFHEQRLEKLDALKKSLMQEYFH